MADSSTSHDSATTPSTPKPILQPVVSLWDRITAWVNGIETANAYKEALRVHHSGTSTWIFDKPEFLAWNLSSSPAPSSSATKRQDAHLLWIHAPAGVGKTVLAAQIINRLAKRNRPEEVNENDDLQAYFFCSSEDFLTREPLAILRSWIVQLLGKEPPVSSVVELAHRRLQEIDPSAGGDQDPTAEDLLDILGVVASGLSRSGVTCTLVVDGYDECRGVENNLLTGLIRTVRNANIGVGLVKVLIVSRDEEYIRKQIDPTIKETGIQKLEMEITAEDMKPDIAAYVVHLAESYSKALTDSSSQGDHEKLIGQMTEKSDGRFLWIKLLESRLASKLPTTTAESLEIVETTPLSIEDIYNQELNRISALPITPNTNCGQPRERDIAITLLRWTLFAVRPLSVLQHATAPVWAHGQGLFSTNPGFDSIWGPWRKGEFSAEDVRRAIQKLAGPLIIITPPPHDVPDAPFDSHLIRLVHPSLRFYMRRHLDDSAATWVRALTLRSTKEEHFSLYQLCLKYLTLTSFDDASPLASLLRGKDEASTCAEKDFSSYGAWAWYPHFLSSADPSQLVATDKPKSVPLPLDLEWPGMDKPEAGNWPDGRQSPLYFAAYCGNLDVIRWCETLGIQAAGPSVESGGRYGFPLQAAAVRRHIHVIKHILARYPNPYPHSLVAEPEDPSDLVSSPPKPDPSEPSIGPGEHGSALAAAIRGPLPPSIEIVQLLLPRSTPYVPGPFPSFPIPSAEIHKTDATGLTPLHHAAEVNSPEIATLLLKNGRANPDILTPQHFSPAFIAAGLGNTAVMRVLLSHGADISSNVKPGPAPAPGAFPTPLQQAVMCSPDPDTISIMIDSLNNGVGHMRGDILLFPDGMGALQACLTNSPSHLGNLRVLLEKGVSPDEPDKTRWTPLQIAAARGDIPAMRLLVNEGRARPNGNPGVGREGGRGYSALQMGIVHGQVESVRCLGKELGADVDEASGNGITPLMTVLMNSEGRSNEETLSMFEILVEELGCGLGGVMRDNYWGVFDVASKSKGLGDGLARELKGRLVRAGCFASRGFKEARWKRDGDGTEVSVGEADVELREKVLTMVLDGRKGELAHVLTDSTGKIAQSKQLGAIEMLEESLRVAAAEGHVDLVGMLLDQEGITVNGQDVWIGRTALHHAVMYSRKEVWEMLVNNGADAEIQDFKGITPLELARFRADNGEDSVRAFVESYGDHGHD